jgi:alanine-glyoxylate transaminase/serine-glyoxylate transaminase/serine-pyruvate transaminase
MLYLLPAGYSLYWMVQSGILAMEMALVNTVMPGERILVLSQGHFGDRFAQIAERYGMVTDRIASPLGERVAIGEVMQALSHRNYKAVAVTHVDTSTGIEADLETLVALVKDSGALFLLDGVWPARPLKKIWLGRIAVP